MDGENTNGGQEATQGGAQEQAQQQGGQQEAQGQQEVGGNAGGDWEKQIVYWKSR